VDEETRRVPPEQDGERLDKVLAGMERVGSRGRARKVLASGKVTVDGEPMGEADQGRRVPAGALVVIAWSRPGTAFARHAARAALDRAGLEIRYEDRALIAVDKPAGLLTDSATRKQAREEVSVRAGVHALMRPRGDRAFVVHRIDRDTTGVVLLAKTEPAMRHLRAQFRAHGPERVYRCVVHGRIRGEEGEWSHPMAWNGRILRQEVVDPEHPRAVLASARWRVLERFGALATLLEVRLHTGRRNQIRLHAEQEGHPLVGERLYVPVGFEVPPPLRFHRQALHAARLGVEHPDSGERVVIESPDPPDLADLLRRLR